MSDIAEEAQTVEPEIVLSVNITVGTTGECEMCSQGTLTNETHDILVDLYNAIYKKGIYIEPDNALS